MNLINLVIGAALIAIGFFAKKSPESIAGINSLSEEEREKVDLKGLSTYLRNGLVVLGLITVGGYWLFIWLGYKSLAYAMTLLPSLIGAIYLVAKSQKFYNK